MSKTITGSDLAAFLYLHGLCSKIEECEIAIGTLVKEGFLEFPANVFPTDGCSDVVSNTGEASTRSWSIIATIKAVCRFRRRTTARATFEVVEGGADSSTTEYYDYSDALERKFTINANTPARQKAKMSQQLLSNGPVGASSGAVPNTGGGVGGGNSEASLASVVRESSSTHPSSKTTSWHATSPDHSTNDTSPTTRALHKSTAAELISVRFKIAREFTNESIDYLEYVIRKTQKRQLRSDKDSLRPAAVNKIQVQPDAGFLEYGKPFQMLTNAGKLLEGHVQQGLLSSTVTTKFCLQNEFEFDVHANPTWFRVEKIDQSENGEFGRPENPVKADHDRCPFFGQPCRLLVRTSTSSRDASSTSTSSRGGRAGDLKTLSESTDGRSADQDTSSATEISTSDTYEPTGLIVMFVGYSFGSKGPIAGPSIVLIASESQTLVMNRGTTKQVTVSNSEGSNNKSSSAQANGISNDCYLAQEIVGSFVPLAVSTRRIFVWGDHYVEPRTDILPCVMSLCYRGEKDYGKDYGKDNLDVVSGANSGGAARSIPTSSSSSNFISVLQYNIWMMPRYITAVVPSSLNLSPATKERSALIPLNIPHADVLCFNEAFCNHTYKRMRSLLRTKHYLYETLPCHSRFINSGIRVASRYPITKSVGIVYKHVASDERGASKGAHYACVRKKGRNVHLFCTHLQAWNTKGAVQARTSQVNELKAFIDAQQIPRNEAVLLVGDFNIDIFNFLERENGRVNGVINGNVGASGIGNGADTPVGETPLTNETSSSFNPPSRISATESGMTANSSTKSHLSDPFNREDTVASPVTMSAAASRDLEDPPTPLHSNLGALKDPLGEICGHSDQVIRDMSLISTSDRSTNVTKAENLTTGDSASVQSLQTAPSLQSSSGASGAMGSAAGITATGASIASKGLTELEKELQHEYSNLLKSLNCLNPMRIPRKDMREKAVRGGKHWCNTFDVRNDWIKMGSISSNMGGVQAKVECIENLDMHVHAAEKEDESETHDEAGNGSNGQKVTQTPTEPAGKVAFSSVVDNRTSNTTVGRETAGKSSSSTPPVTPVAFSGHSTTPDLQRRIRGCTDTLVDGLFTDIVPEDEKMSSAGSECLDMILVPRDHAQPKTSSVKTIFIQARKAFRHMNNPVKDLSDHYPVLGEFTFD